jgi:hypothetical protein
MSWSGVESYRQLENEYQQALEDYTREEATYRELLSREPSSPELPSKYDELTKLQKKAEQLYSQLSTMRSELASAR